MANKLKIVVGITGASGSIYAKVLLEKLQQMKSQVEEVGVVMSDNAKQVWETELEGAVLPLVKGDKGGFLLKRFFTFVRPFIYENCRRLQF